MPNQSVFEFTETGLPTSVYFTPQTNQQGTYSGNYNPVALAKEGQYRILSEKIIPKLQVQRFVHAAHLIAVQIQRNIQKTEIVKIRRKRFYDIRLHEFRKL